MRTIRLIEACKNFGCTGLSRSVTDYNRLRKRKRNGLAWQTTK